MKKKLFLMSLFITSFIENKIWAFPEQTLNVCSESGFVPFEMKDNAGNWNGFDIDLIKKFTEKNQLKLVIIDISLDGLIPALATKKCDVIASALTITEDRKKAVLFSKPIYTVFIAAAFLDSPGIKNKYKTFNDIDKPGVKIASQTGSAASLYLKKNFYQSTLMQYASENDELNALLQKKSDVLIEDNIFISHVQNKLNKKLYVLLSTEKGDLAFATRKEDTQLLSKLNLFIDEIKRNGEYEIIKAKYLGM